MIELIEKLKTKYINTVSLNLDNTIYQSTEMYNDTPISINYFDFSQQIPETLEEIQKYHDDYILPSYYKESGSIQWNYYIYFIFDDTEKKISNDVLNLVEKNKDYARKIIFNKKEFEGFLNENITDFYNHTELIGSDLIGEWRSKLDDNNLSMVYKEEIPKSRIVDELLALKEEETKKNKKQKKTSYKNIKFPTNDHAFIDSVHLGDYRTYPEKREFNFGVVNLIHGVNGAGKTSLLEAIELVTCGKTFRNQKGDEPSADSLRLRFPSKEFTVPKDNAELQERDKQWYGSVITWGNKLYESFNKFNFYNADAAYNISGEKDIADTIKNLVLGKEVAFYEKRVKESLEKFISEQRRLNKESEKLKPKILEAKQEIEALNKSTVGVDELQDKLLASLRALGWKKNSLYNDKLDLDDMFLEIAQLKENISNIQKLSEFTGLYNLGNFDTEYKIFVDDYAKLNDSLSRVREVEEKKKVFFKGIEETNKKIANLQKLAEWLNVDNISQLSGLDERLSELKKKYIRLESLMCDIPPSEEMKKYLNMEESFLSFLSKLTSTTEKLKETRNKNLKDLKYLEDSIGTLNTYKSNLQDYVFKILTLSDSKTQCPVCRSSFSEDELKKLVDNITLRIDSIEEIQSLKKDIETLNNQIEASEKDSRIINILIKVGKELLPNMDFSITAGKVIIEKVLEHQEVLKKQKFDIENLEKQKQHFLSIGITEIEYSKFINNYNERYSKEFGSLSEESLQKIKKLYLLELLSQEDTLKNFDEKIDAEERIIAKLKLDYKVSFEEHQELLQYFTVRKNKLLSLQKEKDSMNLYINPQQMQIEYIVSEVSELSVIAKQLSDILIQNKKSSLAVESLQKKVDDDEKRNKVINENLDKLNDAIDVLEKLESVEQRLFDFFIDNTEGILDVFMSIHAPKEFDGLKFDDGIQLKRIGSQSYDSTTKISTGQRSALALSIFLTMNKNAKNAPKYILFDDPVSDIDDINILAFFDFLREISISGERQIFFATASSKIANLFKKKFDFLGEKFKYNYLER